MQKIKIMIIILFLLVGFAFNGELYMLYLDNFQESYYQSTFCISSPEDEADNDQMIQDFVNAGNKNAVDFFIVDWQMKTVYETSITIYGTENAIEALAENGIKEGKNKSLFFGSSKVEYKVFQEIDDFSICDTLYYIGDSSDKEKLDAFKAELIDQYGGGFPKKFGSDKETYLNLLAVWGMLFLLSLMVTLYSVVYQKKERMVRIILGENIKTLFLKNVLIETLSYSFLFVLVSAVLSKLSNAYFKSSFVILLFVIFLILNALINALILKINFKKDLSTANSGKAFLRINYLLKFMLTTLVVVILASNFLIIKDAYNLYEQKEFFQKHSDYSYCQLDYKNVDINEDTHTSMNQSYYEKFQNDALMYIDLTYNLDTTYPAVLVNRGAMKEILAQNSALNKEMTVLKEDKLYLLLPENISLDSKEAYLASETANIFFDDRTYETITYNSSLAIVGILKENNYQMTMYSNPIILFNNKNFKINASLTGYDMYYACDTMYNISNEDFQNFVEKNNLENQIAVKSNVLDVYEYEWSIASRNMRLILLLSTFLILLEMALIVFIIRLNYQFNALELALLKINGYSLLRRNAKILKITVGSALVGIIMSLVLSRALDMAGGYPLILIGVVLMFLESLYILYRAEKMEKKAIASILKGERI